MSKRRVRCVSWCWILTVVWLATIGAAMPALAQDDDTSGDEVAAIVLVTNQSVGTLAPELYGLNLLAADHFGDDAGGLWTPESSPCAGGIVGCYQPSSFNLLHYLQPGLLRFPGGRVVRSYDWRAGVGPAAERDYYFGTDEYLYLTQRTGATPVITLSLYDPQNGAFATDDVIAAAAMWVDYVNHDSPFGPVTYWEVDSDTWENSVSSANPDVAYKRVPPEAYAEAFLRLSEVLREVDPSIRLGAVSYEYKGTADTYRLLEAFAASGADTSLWPDYLVMSFYRPNFDKDICNLYGADLDAELRRIMAAAFAASRELETRLGNLFAAIDDAWGGYKADVPVFISEYNTQLLFAENYTDYPGPDDPPLCPFRNLSVSLGAAVYNADVLFTLMPYTDRLLGAAQWTFMDTEAEDPGTYGMAYPREGTVVERPNALMMKLAAHDFRNEEILQSIVSASTFDNEAVGRTPSYKSISVGSDENYIRVRVLRHREPVENTLECGTGNIYNPDPVSQISGSFFLDNLSLKQDNIPPALAVELLTNGDFTDPLDEGWQTIADPTGVTTERLCEDDECALRIQFADTAGNNPDYPGAVAQTVAVQPGGRYRLSFDFAAQELAVKTQNLLCDPSWEYTSTPGAYANAYWVQYSSTPAPAAIVAENCYDGSLCVEVPILGNPEYYHVRQRYWLVNNATPELADPDTYHVVGYIKTANLDGPVTIEAQGRNAADQLLQAEESYGLFGDADWTPQDFRFQLADRANTAFINVHLRRKEGRKDNGVAYFDNIRMYRDEYLYAPRIAVDICRDAACGDYRTLEMDGVLGTHPWTADSLGGTPLVRAVVGRQGDEVNVLLVNKDLEQTIRTRVDLSRLDLPADLVILKSVLFGASLDADNENSDPGSGNQVLLQGGEYVGDLTEPIFEVALPPYSITGLKIMDPTVNETDPEPIVFDDDESPDDDDASPTPNPSGDDDDNDDGCCGC
ncbi:MAG: hypothetical protein GX444_03695 [Myxococcales bacterium]|nr:hypothetical protein [Myxococcales bacterium]